MADQIDVVPDRDRPPAQSLARIAVTTCTPVSSSIRQGGVGQVVAVVVHRFDPADRVVAGTGGSGDGAVALGSIQVG